MYPISLLKIRFITWKTPQKSSPIFLLIAVCVHLCLLKMQIAEPLVGFSMCSYHLAAKGHSVSHAGCHPLPLNPFQCAGCHPLLCKPICT